MSELIVSSLADSANPLPLEYDPSVTVESRLGGGTVTVQPEHLEWLGETIVKVDVPGGVLPLRVHEALDLADALRAVARLASR